MAIIHSVSPGFENQVSAPPPAKKTAGLIEKVSYKVSGERNERGETQKLV
jgi:hypothetical protein